MSTDGLDEELGPWQRRDSARRVLAQGRRSGRSFMTVVEDALAARPLAAATADPYAGGFALGDALGRLYCRRNAVAGGPSGLAAVIERITCRVDDNACGDAEVRRQAVLAGFCWRIEQVLRNSHGGTATDDPPSRCSSDAQS